MPSADELRAKAQQLYAQADKTNDATERLGYVLRALELESDADAMERSNEAAPEGQIQQQGTQPPPPLPTSQDQPVQQQQQVQKPDSDK